MVNKKKIIIVLLVTFISIFLAIAEDKYSDSKAMANDDEWEVIWEDIEVSYNRHFYTFQYYIYIVDERWAYHPSWPHHYRGPGAVEYKTGQTLWDLWAYDSPVGTYDPLLYEHRVTVLEGDNASDLYVVGHRVSPGSSIVLPSEHSEGNRLIRPWDTSGDGWRGANIKLERRLAPTNTPPEISLLTMDNLTISETGTYVLSGQVRDTDGDNIKLTANVGGVTKTQTITSPSNWKNFQFTFNIKNEQISQGVHEVVITADDGNDGIVQKKLNFEVTTSLGNNVYLLVDTLVTEYPEKTYEDTESHPIHQERYRFSHNPSYYDNPNGLFHRNEEWILLNNTNQVPVDRFSNVGHYVLDYQAKDFPYTPYDINYLNRFYKWSELPIDQMNFFVHRKPIAQYNVQLQPNGSNFNVKIKDYSYDIDNVSKSNRGIKQVQTKFRQEAELYWSNPVTHNVNGSEVYNVVNSLPAIANYEVAVRVRDIDGLNQMGVWSDWVEKSFITKEPPPIGFTVNPKENVRNANFTITPNPGVGAYNPSYTITRNADQYVNLSDYIHTGTWNRSFSTLLSSRDYYTIRQEVTSGGVTAEHTEQISVYNRPPVINNTQITDRNNARNNLSSNVNSHTMTNSLRPTLYYRFTDQDSDRQQRYRITIKDMNNQNIASSSYIISNDPTGTTKSWTPGFNLQDRTNYIVEFEAFDGYDWAREVRYFTIQTNRPPVADYDINPNPTNRLTETKFISKAYDPDGDPITHVWHQRKKGTTSWDFFSNIVHLTNLYPELGTYELRQTVTDPFGLSDSLIKDVIVENLAPVAIFDILPIVAYEGDTLRAVDRSTDPENDDIIAHEWEVYHPNGTILTFNTKDLQIPRSVPGTYQFRKRVMDGHGTWSAWTDWQPKIIHELTVKGYVNHTELWNQNRIAYNQSKTRTNGNPRAYHIFFPGEKFLLEADTTVIDPRSDVGATEVHVQIIGTNYKTNLSPTNAGQNNWEGEIWDSDMLRWKDRELIFRFTARWNNGTVKMDEVKITIDDDQYWRQHRKR